jgi:hypothetical protein
VLNPTSTSISVKIYNNPTSTDIAYAFIPEQSGNDGDGIYINTKFIFLGAAFKQFAITH